MSNMDAIGLRETLLVGAGAGTVGGIGIAICGTLGFNTLSQFFAEKENMYNNTSWKATACRVAKWVSIALSGITGTAGSLAVGLGVCVCVHMVFFAIASPVAIATGIGAAVLLQAIVIKKIADQISYNRSLDLAKNVQPTL